MIFPGKYQTKIVAGSKTFFHFLEKRLQKTFFCKKGKIRKIIITKHDFLKKKFMFFASNKT